MTMRLKSIKLAGFKSFVDPTTLPIHSQLVGVVGPNGCGKSNVIDAVRWVMGGTAKNIRGGVSTDVIFSGSTSRKPIGQASVELVFDNADGKLGGEYAKFSEISIKRSINRDSISNYYLNGTKCRLKDINDIFMGTGLGPKSYAIIEQGMISRVVEAKPEELRLFVEEAAGISKYKERRRETENRIRHTRENLDRLSDLREELDKQLQRLHRQAQAAEKYKQFKTQEKQLKISLAVNSLKDIETEFSHLQNELLRHNTELEASLSDLQHLRTSSEKMRLEQHEANDKVDIVQKDYYQLGTEIAKNEQQLEHLQQQKQRLEQSILSLGQKITDKTQLLNENQSKHESIVTEKIEVEPEFETISKTLLEFQNTLQNCESALEDTNKALQLVQNKILEPTKIAEAEKTTIAQIEKQIHEKHQRKIKLKEQLTEINVGTELEIEKLEASEEYLFGSIEQKEQAVKSLSEIVFGLQNKDGHFKKELQQKEREFYNLRAQYDALSKVQEEALGADNNEQTKWLEAYQLQALPRLLDKIKPQPEWVTAIESVLGVLLQSVVVQPSIVDINLDPDHILLPIIEWSHGHQCKIEGLLAQVQNADELPQWLAEKLASVKCSDNLSEALNRCQQLNPNESIVTTCGLWMGKGWLKGLPQASQQENVLKRAQLIIQLKEQIDVLEVQLSELQQQADANSDTLRENLDNLESSKNELNSEKTEHLNVQNELKLKKSQLENELDKKDKLLSDIQDCDIFIEHATQEVAQSRINLSRALDEMELFLKEQSGVQETLKRLDEEYRPLKQEVKSLENQKHQLSLTLNNLSNQLNNIQLQNQQSQADIENFQLELEEVMSSKEEIIEPIFQIDALLDLQLRDRVQVEQQLSTARNECAHIENQCRKIQNAIQDTEKEIDRIKDAQMKHKVRIERLSAQKENEEANLKTLGVDLSNLSEIITDEINKAEGVKALEDLSDKIQKLGAINLAAIEEFDAAQERKQYLDAQHEDLNEALTTLEDAIGKIDKETRSKFKETFDKIDAGFKDLFPRLFGGGEARLILTGEDLLDTGVNIVARPPGKRNATIQQLSGGEKALTAVSLVFSIFLLNPAPFCLLDEVDAPLDDNNVGRFCDLVKEMSKTVQFLYISHNKLAIEMAQALHGVTMREAGVSRLVSVDMEKATKLAAAEEIKES